MDEQIRRQVFLQAAGCMENLVGSGGHVTSYSLIAESFAITAVRPLGDGLTEFAFAALATAQNEYLESPTESQPEEQSTAEMQPEDGDAMMATGGQVAVSAVIVLDAAYGLALDVDGNVRLAGHRCLPPTLWHPDHMQR